MVYVCVLVDDLSCLNKNKSNHAKFEQKHSQFIVYPKFCIPVLEEISHVTAYIRHSLLCFLDISGHVTHLTCFLQRLNDDLSSHEIIVLSFEFLF